MQILITSATNAEIRPTVEMLSRDWVMHDDMRFTWGQLEVHVLVTGVGGVATTLHLATNLCRTKPDLAIQVGVAGSFRESMPVGTVVNVTEECFADLGAEDSDGTFLDVFEINLVKQDAFPFKDGRMLNPNGRDHAFLPSAKGISVNKTHGYAPSIEAVADRYNPDVESMEGAAFFFTCLHFRVPFLEIRAISNMVEPRDRSQWNLPLATDNLNQSLIEILSILQN